MAEIPTSITPGDHMAAMRLALVMATRAPRLPTNYCVGAVIVHTATGRVVASGHSLELPGNTHAEECCLLKLAHAQQTPLEEGGTTTTATTTTTTTTTNTTQPAVEDSDPYVAVSKLPTTLTEPHTLYTTMEPCVRRLSGRTACVDRVLEQKSWLTTVCYGFREPDTFVRANHGLAVLASGGLDIVHVPGLEEEICRVATMGHPR